ncbi:hypothetical protein TrVE_jg5382 [Triparma verrucosa]|uniref:Plastid lipid-associated protein/fibrillin conserved domain-containing protein n=1 Tax=Triparma verrucosa TaxID=1606542 RepID=A0A9W7B0W4_9STRA|nr:hypothetical protein TrVE_jg5382 [Triparma verrucosa]
MMLVNTMILLTVSTLGAALSVHKTPRSFTTTTSTTLFSTQSTEVEFTESLLSALPPVDSSPFLTDRAKIEELTSLVAALENAYDETVALPEGDVDEAVIWRLRTTTPIFGTGSKLPLPSSPLLKTPNLEVFQVIRDGGLRIDNVIYVPPTGLVKTGSKITLIHDASVTRAKTYLNLKSVVLTKVEDDAPSIWSFGGEEDEENDKIEDVFGVNVPMAPEILSGFAGLNGFEETFKDKVVRVTRGGSGLGGIWGGFRVFERVENKVNV